ncbi:thiol reductant ABC exporter subunit CydD [Luteococcus peritonei]|uniref:Thiol reductant ABC exporter subunit CydD n=1 Tax=Luteococcus peritonei TaxID=88874 RepID=A0ABW4RYU2_9ACTN
MAGPIDPRLVRRGRATRWFLVALCLVGLVQAVALVAQAHLLSVSISQVFASHRADQLVRWIWPLAAVFALRAALAWLNALLAHRASAAVKAGLRHDLARARLARPLDPGTSSSTLVTLATQGLDALDGYYAKYLPQLVLAVLVPLVVGVMVLRADVLSAVVMAVTLPLIPVFMVLIGWTTQKQVDRRWRVQTRLANHFADLVTGLPTLQAFGRARGQREGLRVTEERNRAETMKTLRISFLSSFALELIATLSVAVVAVQVGFRVVFDRMDLQTALFVLVLAPEAYLPLRQVGTHYHDAADGMAAADQALGYLEAAGIDEADEAGGVEAPTLPLAPTLELRGIRHTWPGAQHPVLDGVDLVLPPGEVVALQGRSGGGKSTLVSVLMGFLEPDEGQVLVDGELWPAARRRELIAWVGQEPGLPADTIGRNVALGSPHPVPDQVLREVLDLAGGQGLALERTVGDDAEGLSAGERRRVAVARALLRISHGRARLLVMDEPTAGLDADAEAAVVEAVRRSGAGALVVSHRPAMLAMADRLVQLDGREPAGSAAGAGTGRGQHD